MKWLLRLAYQLYGWQIRLRGPLVLGVRILLIQESQVYLVKHSYMRGWYCPGGTVKRRELPAHAVRREAHEEAGAILHREPELLGVYSRVHNGENDHLLAFYSHDFALAEATDRWEIVERGFFPLDALPDDVAKESRQYIEDYLAGNRPYVGIR